MRLVAEGGLVSAGLVGEGVPSELAAPSKN